MHVNHKENYSSVNFYIVTLFSSEQKQILKLYSETSSYISQNLLSLTIFAILYIRCQKNKYVVSYNTTRPLFNKLCICDNITRPEQNYFQACFKDEICVENFQIMFTCMDVKSTKTA